MALMNLGVKALLGWISNLTLPHREIKNIEELQNGELLLHVVYKMKKEQPRSITSPRERFKFIAEFVEKVCRFSATQSCSLSWDNINNGINLTLEIAKVLLLLVYHDMMSERCTLKTLDCEVEGEIANLTVSYVMESEGRVYLSHGLDAYLARQYLPVTPEIFARTTSTSTSSLSTASTLSDEDSPVFHRTKKIAFVNMHTVASSSSSKSPLQDIMNTPKFQLRKIQREMIRERDYRDGLEKELAVKISLIVQRESLINQLQYHLDKMKREQTANDLSTREQINELEMKNNSLQLRLNELLKENKEGQCSFSLMERKVNELEEDNGVLSSQMRALHAQLSMCRAEVVRLTERQASLQEKWRAKEDYLNSELSQATSQKELLTEQIQILQGKISCLEEEIRAATKQDVGENMGPVIEKALEKEVAMLILEKERLVQTMQATERENLASLKMEQALKEELESLKMEKALLLKEMEKKQEPKWLKKDLQEQLVAKTEAVEHYKAQMEKAVSHYNDKKQLLQESQEEVAKLKHTLAVKEREVNATGTELKLLQLQLEKAQSKEKDMLSKLARLEAQVAFSDLNLHAHNQIPDRQGETSELCYLELPDLHANVHKVEPERMMSSDILDQSSLEDSLNSTRKLSAPGESSTPLVRSSERLAAKRRGLKAESLESLYFTPINTRHVHRATAEIKTRKDLPCLNPSSSVKRRRTTQVINITMTKKTPGGVEHDETFYSLALAQSQPNLSGARGARTAFMELSDTPAKRTEAVSDQLSGLPGYQRSTSHSQNTSTFCVGAVNEPEGAPDDWMRIAELQARNKACLPHLKSSYPVEFETGFKTALTFTDEDVRTGDPTETIRRASVMPGQLQELVTSHRLSLAAPHLSSTSSVRSHPLAMMAGYPPSKSISSSQLKSPRCSKRSASTLSVTQTSPKVDRRQSMMFTIDNTPKNSSNYLKRGLNKLHRSTHKSPGKTSKKSPAKTAHKENKQAGPSRAAAGRVGSFKSPQVVYKENKKTSQTFDKSPRLTESARMSPSITKIFLEECQGL
nr:nuclear mitotic apparatus protein 1-like isoform X2 [Syngnathus scovelli]XP_049581644.1 nuclear mitotic apparatus protein 1-like isoform X2 [Syngnathus scovelli]